MQKKEEILESFKTAIKSTIKSISNKDDIEISFGGQDVSSGDNKLKLPEINEFQNKIEIIGDTPTIGAEGFKVIFIHPRSAGGVLVELAERNDS